MGVVKRKRGDNDDYTPSPKSKGVTVCRSCTGTTCDLGVCSKTEQRISKCGIPVTPFDKVIDYGSHNDPILKKSDGKQYFQTMDNDFVIWKLFGDSSIDRTNSKKFFRFISYNINYRVLHHSLSGNDKMTVPLILSGSGSVDPVNVDLVPLSSDLKIRLLLVNCCDKGFNLQKTAYTPEQIFDDVNNYTTSSINPMFKVLVDKVFVIQCDNKKNCCLEDHGPVQICYNFHKEDEFQGERCILPETKAEEPILWNRGNSFLIQAIDYFPEFRKLRPNTAPHYFGSTWDPTQGFTGIPLYVTDCENLHVYNDLVGTSVQELMKAVSSQLQNLLNNNPNNNPPIPTPPPTKKQKTD